MSLGCKAWYLSHRGKERSSNEDSLLVGDKVVAQGDMTDAETWESEGDRPFCVCVADGMGGHKAGERASMLCCEELAQMNDLEVGLFRERLLGVNRRIYQESDRDPGCAAMGTTVAGLAYLGDELVIFSVGDSRVYRIAGSSLVQLNRDDTTAQAMEDAGILEQGAIRPPKLHGLTQAMGGSLDFREIDPWMYHGDLKDGCAYLLCTDGLTDMLSRKQMEEAFSPGNPDRTVDALFDAAMDAGGADNLSLIYLEFEQGLA